LNDFTGIPVISIDTIAGTTLTYSPFLPIFHFPRRLAASRSRMIPKSGNRFSDKIMRKNNVATA
jgi:hypothetical protein